MRARLVFIRNKDNRIYSFEETSKYWVNLKINSDINVYLTDKETKVRKLVFKNILDDIKTLQIER
jgi:Zn-finger domain-containing protein